MELACICKPIGLVWQEVRSKMQLESAMQSKSVIKKCDQKVQSKSVIRKHDQEVQFNYVIGKHD